MKSKEPKVENSQVANLKDGLKSPFWTTLKGIVEDEKTQLEVEIFENEGLSDKQRDDLRRWRNFLVYFMSLPEKCIESLEAEPPKDGMDEPNESDPYEKNPLEKVRENIKNA